MNIIEPLAITAGLALVFGQWLTYAFAHAAKMEEGKGEASLIKSYNVKLGRVSNWLSLIAAAIFGIILLTFGKNWPPAAHGIGWFLNTTNIIGSVWLMIRSEKNAEKQRET